MKQLMIIWNYVQENELSRKKPTKALSMYESRQIFIVPLLSMPFKMEWLYNFDLPIVCHGYASVLSIQISAFRESGDKSFLITRERNMRQTIISHRNCIFNDEYTNDYSILSGESGTILTLINGIYLGKEYPKLLMID